MTSVLYGIVILCLLSTIHDGTMKADASLDKKAEAALRMARKVQFTLCCAKNCKKGEKCFRNVRGVKGGCRCFKPDKRKKGGGFWNVFPE